MGCDLKRAVWMKRLLGAIGLAALCGCGGVEGDYKTIVETRQNARGTLEAQGAKISSRNLPVIGAAFVVDLSGSTSISDTTFTSLKEMGKGNVVAELNLSRTNVSDKHLALLNDKDLSGGLVKLDLSDTEITDKGLEQITMMLFLGELNLTNTKVTADGVRAFLKTRAENAEVKIREPKIKQ
ncbi:MAG: hypothetical protein ACT4QC_16845 [Planctomycetaceae bacterium]